MLNYNNLSDIEFENLAKDIMEKKLKQKLQNFGPGKDGGVDLKDIENKNKIIVQVKHYRKSSSRALYRSLKKELKKLKQ